MPNPRQSKSRSLNTGVSRRRRVPTFKLPEHVSGDGLSETLGVELLSVCIAALKSYGLSSKSLKILVSRALKAEPSSLATTSRVLDDAQRLAEAVNRWGEDPEYLDETGSPALLSTIGPRPSFAALSAEYFAGRELGDVISFGCDAGVIERVSGDRVARLNNCVVLTGNSFLMLAHSVRAVRRFLATADHNRHKSTLVSEGWPDRVSYVDVSDEDFTEFIRVMRQQIVGLVEMSNRWLVHRAANSKATKKPRKRIAGVHAFIFQD